MTTIQKTIVIVKPETVVAGRVDDIRHDLRSAGLTVLAETPNRRITLDEARSLHTAQRGAVPSEKDIESMLGARGAHVFLLAHIDAVAIAAREVALTLRPRYNNGVYGSDGPIAADRDVRFFFPRSVSDGVPADNEAREYVQAHLQEVLVRGLTEIAKTKPQDPIRYLAEFLLNSNPNRPRVAM